MPRKKNNLKLEVKQEKKIIHPKNYKEYLDQIRNNHERYSYGTLVIIDIMRYDAMIQYLEKHDWLIYNETTESFDIKKHQEVFDKINNLEFEEAIDAVRIYEKKILKRT